MQDPEQPEALLEIRDEASDTLREVRRAFLEAREIDDPDLGRLVSERLVDDVFDTAWKNQFEKDRGPFERAVRKLVEDGD